MVEVLVAALLIFMSLGGIFAMNARSLQILRSTRQVTASSLMAQQRLETLRSRPWPEFSNSTALMQLMHTPTESERELADAEPVETVTVAVPGGAGAATSFSVQRKGTTVKTTAIGDLSNEPMLLVTARVQWRELRGTQERARRTVIYRSGLTRSGIFGSALGRPTATPPTNPEP